MATLQDKIHGSLIGGAAGDALGYAVEFTSYNHIVEKYGEKVSPAMTLTAMVCRKCSPLVRRETHAWEH